MVSRIVLVAAAAALVCLAVQVQGAPGPQEARFFFFDIEEKDTETAITPNVPCANDAACNTPANPAAAPPTAATSGYCKNFGGATFLCVAKRANRKKCNRPMMCTSGKCPSICLVFNNNKCIQKCEA